MRAFRLTNNRRAALPQQFKMAANASFVSPTADAKVAHMITQLDGSSMLSTIYNGLSVWSVLFTVLAVAVAYDQCMDLTTRCAGFC